MKENNNFIAIDDEFLQQDQDNDSCAIKEQNQLKARLDKWLWAARFFKTRALARAAIEQGKVLYNGERVRPTIEIEVNASLHIKIGKIVKSIIIKELSTRRKNALDSLQLFEEIALSDQNKFSLPICNKHFRGHTNKNPKKMVRFLRRGSARNEAEKDHSM